MFEKPNNDTTIHDLAPTIILPPTRWILQILGFYWQFRRILTRSPSLMHVHVRYHSPTPPICTSLPLASSLPVQTYSRRIKHAVWWWIRWRWRRSFREHVEQLQLCHSSIVLLLTAPPPPRLIFIVVSFPCPSSTSDSPSAAAAAALAVISDACFYPPFSAEFA